MVQVLQVTVRRGGGGRKDEDSQPGTWREHQLLTTPFKCHLTGDFF